MKRMILLSMVGVVALAVYALAQQAGDAPTSDAAPGRAQPMGPRMGCCAGGMMAGEATNQDASAAGFTCPMHPDVRKAAAGKCPMCRMALVQGGPNPAARSQGAMTRYMAMMRKAGMDPAMMKRVQVMVQTPIFLDSPCAVYGQAANLELSDEQKAKLTEIENEARKKALAVLTPEQKKKMGDIPAKPMAMMQMCAKMMPMMQEMMGGKGGPMMMCPMMQGMNGRANREGSGTPSEGSGTKPSE